MVLCDHTFYPTKYQLTLSVLENGEKRKPVIDVEVCRDCGILRVARNHIKDMVEVYF